MIQIEKIIRNINRELAPQFEQRLREQLAGRDKEWLIEQVVRLTLDAHSLREKDGIFNQRQKKERRAQRFARIKDLGLDSQKLDNFIARYASFDRALLLNQGFLTGSPPEKGARAITAKNLSDKGQRLLQESKDVLFAILFGDAANNTHFHRTRRELLSVTLPQFKADALDFMQADTEIDAEGTWRDPKNISNDEQAKNIILQVEYGEIKEELLGHGIVRTLSLINNLEINEQLLYARIIKVEESTLIT